VEMAGQGSRPDPSENGRRRSNAYGFFLTNHHVHEKFIQKPYFEAEHSSKMEKKLQKLFMCFIGNLINWENHLFRINLIIVSLNLNKKINFKY
jgi:hypothetical protein